MLIEKAVEQDDEAMEAYLDGEEPSMETLKACIRKGSIDNVFVPVLCGTAFKNKGVQPLLDAVLDYLPRPSTCPTWSALTWTTPKRSSLASPRTTRPFSGLAFKIMADPFVGSLTFLRMYSGVLESGTYAYNSVKGKKERIGRLLQMHANSREDVKDAVTGDIVAIAGLKDTTTGDTLCDQGNQIILERMEFPDPRD